MGLPPAQLQSSRRGFPGQKAVSVAESTPPTAPERDLRPGEEATEPDSGLEPLSLSTTFGVSTRQGLGLAAAALLFAALVYFRTAARDIVVGDTAELVTVALTLGVA